MSTSADRAASSRTPNVTIRVDGEDIPAVRGEPIAAALVASGRWVFGRSVKYHRPRGPQCMTKRCDGCLMRVDGAPNQRTCDVACDEGVVVETQNVLGSARFDLLEATDVAFPVHMNHHELMTRPAVLNAVMQTIAREVAGIGTLPSEVVAPTPVERVDVDVLIVGAGLAGRTAARAIAAAAPTRTILLVDERHLGDDTLPSVELPSVELPSVELPSIELRRGVAAVGVFFTTAGEREILLDGPTHASIVRATTLILATGRAETNAMFAGNDRPGVISFAACERFLAHGVLPGRRVLVAAELSEFADGDGPARLTRLTRSLVARGATVEGPVPLRELERVVGRSKPRLAVLEGRRVAADLVVVASRTGAVYELALQAGARVRFERGAFELEAQESDGATGVAGLYVIGAAADVRDAATIEAQCSGLARTLVDAPESLRHE